jgi:hypothetical protein
MEDLLQLISEVRLPFLFLNSMYGGTAGMYQGIIFENNGSASCNRTEPGILHQGDLYTYFSSVFNMTGFFC